MLQPCRVQKNLFPCINSWLGGVLARQSIRRLFDLFSLDSGVPARVTRKSLPRRPGLLGLVASPRTRRVTVAALLSVTQMARVGQRRSAPIFKVCPKSEASVHLGRRLARLPLTSDQRFQSLVTVAAGPWTAVPSLRRSGTEVTESAASNRCYRTTSGPICPTVPVPRSVRIRAHPPPEFDAAAKSPAPSSKKSFSSS
jgi:hypothetical protein